MTNPRRTIDYETAVASTRATVAWSKALREQAAAARREASGIIDQSRQIRQTSCSLRRAPERELCWFTSGRPYEASAATSVCWCRTIKCIVPSC